MSCSKQRPERLSRLIFATVYALAMCILSAPELRSALLRHVRANWKTLWIDGISDCVGIFMIVSA
jgi:hypothetical protein